MQTPLVYGRPDRWTWTRSREEQVERHRRAARRGNNSQVAARAAKAFARKEAAEREQHPKEKR